MIDFIYETRKHLLSEHPAWFSKGEYKCGLSRLEFSVSSEERSSVNEEMQSAFSGFISELDTISQKISDEVQERFEKISRMGGDPYGKLVKQMEDSLSFMSNTMLGASEKDKNDSMAKIRENLMSAIPPKEEGNENLSQEDFHTKTLVTANIAPYESTSLIYIYVVTPHCYSGEDIILMNWHEGRFLSFDECQEMADQEFNDQEGEVFQGLKFVNIGEPVSEEKVSEFEKQLAWQLPESYKAFLKSLNGGLPALSGDGRVPSFDKLTDDQNETMTLKWRNFETDLDEYLKVGFFTFADAGEGFGGHSSIYLKPGAHYGKVFCWYWDDCLCLDEPMDSEINSMFFDEHLVANDFSGFIEYLKEQSDEETDLDEDKVDVQEWLEGSKKRTLSTMTNKESLKFVKKLFKKGCLEVYTDEYLDEFEDNIDDLELKLKDSKDVRLDLESWLDKKNWVVNQYEKNHWNISSLDFDEDEFLWDNIETMLMIKFDFIDLEEIEEWTLVGDVVESMQKVSKLSSSEVEKEVINIFKEALKKDVSLSTDIRAYIDY